MRPDRFKLFSKNWTVKYSTEMGKDLGECDIEQQTVTVKDELLLEQEQSTLLHELLHAISDSLGLCLTEKQVLGLESGLYDLDRSNPQLFSYLKKIP